MRKTLEYILESDALFNHTNALELSIFEAVKRRILSHNQGVYSRGIRFEY